MDQHAKIDLILSKVSAMETKVALIEERTEGIKERVEHGEDRIEKVEVITHLFQTERANILFVLKWTGIACGSVASCIALFILIANYIHK